MNPIVDMIAIENQPMDFLLVSCEPRYWQVGPTNPNSSYKIMKIELKLYYFTNKHINVGRLTKRTGKQSHIQLHLYDMLAPEIGQTWYNV